MTYRPDIDGLRAVAIILVLLYHGGLSIVPSGFIGVDIFFVLSGFLITHIIHHSLNTNNFSFIDFYNRRLWRLQPVFICLILVTTIVTLLLFLPEELIQYTRSARKTSLFISNLFFNHATTGYFSPDTLQLPLLHTWSLSIEWQCYLLLPLTMYCIYRQLGTTNRMLVILGLTLISLLCSLYHSKEVPSENYFLFSSRIFEFLIGSCIAIMPIERFVVNKYVLNSVAFLALITLFFIAHLDNIRMAYPNGYAIAVCVATGILVISGSPTVALNFNSQPLLISRVLSIRPVVFIGVLSYSLYIWHWLVFAILRYQSVYESTAVLSLTYAVIFILAYLSWRFIEKPSKKLKHFKFSYTVTILLVVPILFTHLSAFLIKFYSGLPQRFNNELTTVYRIIDQYNSVQRPLCISNNKMVDNDECRIGSKETLSKKGLMIGDSFSNHYWGFIDTLGKAGGISILAQGTSSCITLPGIYLYDWWHFKNKVYQECYDQTVKYYQLVQDNHFEYVIIGQFWNNYFSDKIINKIGDTRSLELTKKRLKVALDQALKIITASGAKPVLIKSTAFSYTNMHDCFFKHIKLHQSYNSAQCSFPLHISENDLWLDKTLIQMHIKYPQLIVIDPKKVQCKNNVCQSDLNGIPVYRDEGHITDYASYEFGSMYLQQYGNPLG